MDSSEIITTVGAMYVISHQVTFTVLTSVLNVRTLYIFCHSYTITTQADALKKKETFSLFSKFIPDIYFAMIELYNLVNVKHKG